eukprot:gene7921-9747_t
MNTVKVKQTKDSFNGFRKEFPQGLYGTMTPSEFESTVESINVAAKSVKMPKIIAVPIIILVIGFILAVAGFVKDINKGLIAVGIIMAVGGFIGLSIIMCITGSKLKKAIEHQLDEANNFYAMRRIRFRLGEKIPKNNHHSNHHNNKKFTKLYIEIEFPAPSYPVQPTYPPQPAFPQPSYPPQPQPSYPPQQPSVPGQFSIGVQVPQFQVFAGQPQSALSHQQDLL